MEQDEDEACIIKQFEPLEIQKWQDNPQYASIGVIISRSSCLHIGTAFVVSPNTIVTAAHNIMDHSENTSLQKDIMFYPKAFGKLGEGVKVIKVEVCKEFKEGKQQSAWDYALCLLESPINAKCLTIGFNYQYDQSDLPQENSKLHIYGYPGQHGKNLNGAIANSDFQVSLRGLSISSQRFSLIESTDLSKGEINHKISTKSGYSGAPITFEVYGEFAAIGLVKGVKSNQETKQPEFNVGTLFNVGFIRRLNEFIKNNEIKGQVIIRNMNILKWSKESMMEVTSFQDQQELVHRLNCEKEICQIRSGDLRKMFSSRNVLKLKLNNFYFRSTNTKIQFGVMMTKVGKKDDKIRYIIYNLPNTKGVGRLSKETERPKYHDIQELFISQTQFLNMTINLHRGKVIFAKANMDKQLQQFNIDLEKWYREEGVEIIFYAKINGVGCSFDVMPKVKQQL